ncbi:MAG TPA: glycosyltransferase [Candidatus Binatia bacterium]|nr:glycosyltransferase [Candidatus Binatia bacterium]
MSDHLHDGAGPAGGAPPPPADPGRDAPPARAREAGASPPGVTVAVLARSDEPALAATLRSLERAAGKLAARGHAVSFVICVNGEDGREALADARSFADCMRSLRTAVIREPLADKARAWNLARSSCATPIVVFCDADVDVAPDALVVLVDALAAAPRALLASARQVPALAGASAVARAAALPYRFDFGVVGGRLYAMRSSAVARMPEGLLLEDGWLSAVLGREQLLVVDAAEVRFRPPETLADYFRERLRTEAGKVQIREARRSARGGAAGLGPRRGPIARYPWREMARRLAPGDWPLAAINLGVRAAARVAAEVAARTGHRIRWATIATSKPPRAAAGGKA